MCVVDGGVEVGVVGRARASDSTTMDSGLERQKGSMRGSSWMLMLEGSEHGDEGREAEKLSSAQSLSSGNGSVRQPSSTSMSMPSCSRPRRAILVGSSCEEGVFGDGSCVAERFAVMRAVVWWW